MDYKDYYKSLGLNKTASEKEIKSAFRKLAQKYHPDRNPGDKKSEDKFKEINEANEVLSDPQKRAKYDQLGASYAQWERMGRPGGGFDFGQWAAGQSGGARDPNDLFGEGSLSDLLNNLFGGMGGMGTASAGRAAGPRTAPRSRWGGRGEDLEQPVEITLEEAFSGAERTLQREGRTRTVTIPAGARTGTKVRYPGEGGPGQPNGDLYLVVSVLAHAKFQREDDDLRVDVPVDMFTALLGGETRVATLDGEVLLTIPPETQGGKTFRLVGKGMPKLRQPQERGNLYARIVIQIPTQLTEPERALISELAALRGKRK